MSKTLPTLPTEEQLDLDKRIERGDIVCTCLTTIATMLFVCPKNAVDPKGIATLLETLTAYYEG